MRIQSFQPGFALKEAFKRLADVLAELDKHLTIAVHPRHGYINACPTNCGTGKFEFLFFFFLKKTITFY